MNTKSHSNTAFILLMLSASLLCGRTGPNVVLFLVDDMGWMDSSAYGSAYYETPNMERFSKESMRFTDAYAVPLCSPTRASILSGQYSSRHRITSASGHQPPADPEISPYPAKGRPGSRLIYANSKNYLDPQIITLAEVLRDAGYRTGHFGKWHLGLAAAYRPEQHGFETAWHAAPDPGPPSYFSPYGVHTDGKPTSRHHVGTITDGPDGEYITDRLTDEALKFIDDHQDEAFYLNLWQFGVHGPWGHKEAYTARFAKKTDPRGQQRNPIMASMLKSVDESLGRVLDKLEELDLAENTLFIFYSDNGGNTHSNTGDDVKIDNLEPDHPRYAFVQDWRKWAGSEAPTNNAPLREGKGRIYEGGQRVPLMVRWPGRIAPGSTSDAIVGPIDLYPTVLEALGISQPAGHVVDGISLMPVLEQSGSLDREAYFTWFPHLIPAVSVRTGDYKLIRRFEPHQKYPEVRELYNLAEDIGETRNLATAMPEKLQELDALIDRFINETGALAPLPNPAYASNSGDTNTPSAYLGLVPKMCSVSMIDGALQMIVEPGKKLPFLGTGRAKHDGPMSLHLRVRSRSGGPGQVRWTTENSPEFSDDGQSTAFKLAANASWQDIRVDLPIEGRSKTIRIYLPAEQEPVDIASISFIDKQSQSTIQSWFFDR